MAAVTANSTALPGPCYDLCFPVLEAVLSSSVHTSLHEQALQVMALHVAPGLPLPRKDTLAVLFHVLGVVPAYRYDLQTSTTPCTFLLLLSSEMTCALTSMQTLCSGGSVYLFAGCRHAESISCTMVLVHGRPERYSVCCIICTHSSVELHSFEVCLCPTKIW